MSGFFGGLVSSVFGAVSPVAGTALDRRNAERQRQEDNRGRVGTVALGPPAPEATTPASTTPNSPNTPQRPPARYITADAANNVLNGLLDDSRFNGNPLNDFFNPTYNFRLFAINDADIVNSMGNPNNSAAMLAAIETIPQITLAQSGVTAGYVIKDITMDTIVSPNYRTRNINLTEIIINIEEPLGVSFLDAMASACSRLGVANPQRCYYGLELTFKGYSEDGSIAANPLSNAGFGNGGKWIWILTFQDIETKLTSSGGSYILKGKPYEQQIFDEARFLRVNESFNVAGGTVGQFLDNLATKMNAAWRNRYGIEVVKFRFNASHPVEFPTPAGPPSAFSLTPREPEVNTARGLSMRQGAVPTAQIPSGTSITDIVEFMFANCEKAQELGLDRGNRQNQTDASQNRVNENGFRQSVIFRIEPEVKITGYEAVSNTYMMDVVLHIRPYYTQGVIVSELQPENAEDPATQQRMIQELDRRGFLKKRYEYIFTGRNTEVIDLDIRYNLAWSAVLPQLEGARAFYEQAQPNARLSSNINPEYDRNAAALRTELITLQQQARAQTASLPTRQREVSEITNRVNRLESQLTRLGQSDPARRSVTEELTEARRLLSIAQRDQETAVSRANETLSRIQSLTPAAQPEADVSAAAASRNRVFAEDDPFFTSPNARARPVISFEQGNDEIRNNVGVGFHGGRTRDRALFGAVLEQLYAPFTGQFITVELSVRGDPYWLGQGNLERQLELRNNQQGESGLPRFIDGDQCFLLTFRYPIGIGEGRNQPEEIQVPGRTSNEGAPVFRSQDIFNGVYRVTKISHTFSDGQFKQNLTAHVLPLIDIIKAFGFRGTNQGVIRNTDQQGPPAPPTPVNPVTPQTLSASEAAAAALGVRIPRV